MKNVTLYITVILLMSLLQSACVKDKMYNGPATISSISYAPTKITPDDAVAVTCKITDLQGISAAVLRYVINQVDSSEITMTETSDNVYTATIPKQEDGTSVEFKIIATNISGFVTTSTINSYISTATPIDYAPLVLNEIDGNSKSVELYNSGTSSIPLKGISLVKDNGTDAWWVGTNGNIPAGGYILIVQDNTDNPDLSGNGGISAKKGLKFVLSSPSGASLGIFLRGTESNIGATISSVAPNSYQRTPNGGGEWKLASPTLGSKNPDTGDAIPQN